MAVPSGNDFPQRDQFIAEGTLKSASHQKEHLCSRPKRVVVVDDSSTIRMWLRQIIDADPRLRVVGLASDAQEARRTIKETNPDVITLDVEMPGMNGLDFLEKLITLRPMPVVMVSSITQRGSDAAIRALSLGAVDCIVKPASLMDQAGERDLTRRVFAAACSQLLKTSKAVVSLAVESSHVTAQRATGQLVLIGASTGGVPALEMVLDGVDPDGPPIVIAQHMPRQYLESFAQRLRKNLARDIAILQAGEQLDYGQVRLAPGGGFQSLLVPEKTVWQATFVPQEKKDIYCPSVDKLFHSACERAASVTAVLLTGLGDDGASGLKALRAAGAHTIGQDCASSVVYGMPRAAFETGAVMEQLPLDQIAHAINRATLTKEPWGRALV